VALVAAIALAPAVARARPAVPEIRGTVRHVEDAIVDDDPGACVLMSPPVQRELFKGSRGLAHLPAHVGCRQAVVRIHRADVANGVEGPERQFLRREFSTLPSTPVLFAFGLRRASLTVIGLEPQPDGSDLVSTLIFDVVRDGGRWKLVGLHQRQQLVVE
jgi:hypothetical protein